MDEFYLYLENGMRAIIDLRDHKLSQYKWLLNSAGYVYRNYTVNGQHKKQFLHRAVANVDKEFVGRKVHVHHQNRNKLDCRRSNLLVIDPKSHRVIHSQRKSHTAC